MSSLKITGGRPLRGENRVQGAKNSVLPIMAASILSAGETTIHNAPALSDVDAAMKILRHLGCRVEKTGGTIQIDSTGLCRNDIPDSLMREMRSSVIFLGAILARCGEAVLSMPGGCELGPRPIDLHLDAMSRMGASINENSGNLICKAGRLRGTAVPLTFPSVGATENALIAAAGCEGTTLITGAAREPEIRDLADFLTALGVNITGAGTSTILIEGARFRPFVEHSVIPDRIAAATYLSAVAAAGGRVTLLGILPRDIAGVTEVLTQMGAELHFGADFVTITAPQKLSPPRTVVTRPYPGFPTDAQPPLMAACLKAEGISAFVETIFENRYRHVPELRRLGADIRVDGRVAIVHGVERLTGAKVQATDLRGGAALVVAALSAEGVTEIGELRHLTRGYEALTDTLRSLGASAELVTTRKD